MPNLIGTNPNQIPTNGLLGSMAFQNKEALEFQGVVSDKTSNLVSLSDIGLGPNQVPLNQYLGLLAHRDTVFVQVPATATSPGDIGDIAADTSYVYFCVAKDTWRRVAISSW